VAFLIIKLGIFKSPENFNSTVEYDLLPMLQSFIRCH
jgi:hypothetical protein